MIGLGQVLIFAFCAGVVITSAVVGVVGAASAGIGLAWRRLKYRS